MDDPRKRKRGKRNQRKNRNPHRDADLFLRNTFYAIIPSKEHKKRVKKLIEKVRNAIQSEFKSEVFVYGSYASETALQHSDVDFSVKMRARDPVQTMREIADILEASGITGIDGFTQLVLPVNNGTKTVYFAFGLDIESDIHVDLSLNNPMAPFSCAFIKAVVQFHFMEKMLLVLIKHFASCHNLNNTNWGLSNIGHTYLGVHILHKNNAIPQFLHKEHISELDDLEQESTNYNIVSGNFSKSPVFTTVASLLLDYFKYYSEDVNYTEMAISIRRCCLVTKKSVVWPKKKEGYYLAIVDPFNGENVGKKVTKCGLRRIRRAFRHALEIFEAGSNLEKLFEPFDFNKVVR